MPSLYVSKMITWTTYKKVCMFVCLSLVLLPGLSVWFWVFWGGLGFYLLIYLRVTVSEKGGGAEERRENFEQTPS